MKKNLLRKSLVLASSLLATVPLAHGQAVRAWSGSSGSAWLTETNWTPNTNFAGEAPLAVLAVEGLATDIMTTVAANTATNIGINMNTLAAGGGVGLILGGIDFNRSVTNNLQIGNSSTTVNGIMQLNGATINSVPNTLVRVAGGASLTIANVNTGTTTQTMGVQLGITNGVLDVGTDRFLIISSNITELTALSSITKTGPGTVILGGTNSFTGGTTVNTGTLSFRTLAAKTAGTHTFAAGTALGLGFGGATQFTAADIQDAFAGTFAGNLADISIGGTNNISIDTTLAQATLSANIGPSPRGLEKILGGANLTLTGTNEYSGRTVVGGGSGFIVNSLGNIADASSNVGTNSTIDLMPVSFLQVGSATTASSDKTLNLRGNTVFFANGTGTAALIHTGSITTETAGVKTFDLRTTATNFNANNISGVISDGSGQLNLRKSNAGTWTVSGANTHTGTTTVAAGTLILSNSLALQNSTLDTTASIAGTGTAGLRTTVTALTLGGLTGSKNVAATGGVFTTTAGGYSGVTALTLNPGTGLTPAYTAVIADGAPGMTLTKTGAGTQTLSGSNTYTGATAVNAGTLALGASGSIASSPSLAIAAGAVMDTSAQATYTISAAQPLELGIIATGTGTSGQITAAGLVVSSASVTYNITGTPDDPAYVLATYTSLTGRFASAPAPPAGYMLDYTYQGNKIALVSTAASPYATWSGGALPNVDANNDSVMNGVAWVLGAANPNALAVGDLPTLDTTSDPGFVIFNYRRSDLANTDTNTVIKAQYGTNLTSWTDAVASADIIITPFNDFHAAGIDKVEVKIRRTLVPNGRIFTRLNALITQ